jgi:hypothetical protein
MVRDHDEIYPLAAMISGKGGMGKAMRQGFGGIAPMMIARSGYKDEEEERRAKEQAAETGDASQNPQPLVTRKKGGMVKSSASKRADGIAIKGKTKGRIV